MGAFLRRDPVEVTARKTHVSPCSRGWPSDERSSAGP